MLALPADIRRYLCHQLDARCLVRLERTCKSSRGLLDEKFWQESCRRKGWEKARYRGWKWTRLALEFATRDVEGQTQTILAEKGAYKFIIDKQKRSESYDIDEKIGGLGFNTHESGYWYEGQCRSGKAEGFGMCTWADGTCYSGEWVANKMQGLGTITWTDGDIFVGYFDGDYRRGAFRWNDGRVAIGIWFSSWRPVKGSYRWPDGSKYRGTFNTNRTRRCGKMTWSDGSTYSGDWTRDHAPGHQGKPWAGFFRLGIDEQRLCETLI